MQNQGLIKWTYHANKDIPLSSFNEEFYVTV